MCSGAQQLQHVHDGAAIDHDDRSLSRTLPSASQTESYITSVFQAENHNSELVTRTRNHQSVEQDDDERDFREFLVCPHGAPVRLDRVHHSTDNGVETGDCTSRRIHHGAQADHPRETFPEILYVCLNIRAGTVCECYRAHATRSIPAECSSSERQVEAQRKKKNAEDGEEPRHRDQSCHWS